MLKEVEEYQKKFIIDLKEIMLLGLQPERRSSLMSHLKDHVINVETIPEKIKNLTSLKDNFKGFFAKEWQQGFDDLFVNLVESLKRISQPNGNKEEYWTAYHHSKL